MPIPRKFISDAMFGGSPQREPQDRALVQLGSGTSPNTVVTAKKGTLLAIHFVGDATHKDVYVNTNGTTGWLLVHDETP